MPLSCHFDFTMLGTCMRGFAKSLIQATSVPTKAMAQVRVHHLLINSLWCRAGIVKILWPCYIRKTALTLNPFVSRAHHVDCQGCLHRSHSCAWYLCYTFIIVQAIF